MRRKSATSKEPCYKTSFKNLWEEAKQAPGVSRYYHNDEGVYRRKHKTELCDDLGHPLYHELGSSWTLGDVKEMAKELGIRVTKCKGQRKYVPKSLAELRTAVKAKLRERGFDVPMPAPKKKTPKKKKAAPKKRKIAAKPSLYQSDQSEAESEYYESEGEGWSEAECPDMSHLKRYARRAGPPRPADDPGCHGRIFLGNDGAHWVSKVNKNGKFTWRRLPTGC
jgi:hypothetical protein